jgi:hypothetical protein
LHLSLAHTFLLPVVLVDAQERLTAVEAMAHPYFSPIRAAEAKEQEGAASGSAAGAPLK